MAVPFGYSVFTAYYAKASVKKDIEALKAAGCTMGQRPVAENKAEKVLNITKWALLGIGIAILVFGFITGGTSDVLTKAVNLCTECIGLG